MASTRPALHAEAAFGAIGLRRCLRSSAAHFIRLAYRAERRSPSGSVRTNAARVNAAVGAAGVGLAVALGHGFTNDERSVVLAAIPGRHARRAAMYDVITFGAVLAATLALVSFALVARLAGVTAALTAAGWTIGAMAVLVVLAALVSVALPPARRRARLVDHYFAGRGYSDRDPTAAVFVEAFAAAPEAPLLAMFHRLNNVADDFGVGLLAVAGNEKRLRVYTGRAAGFQVAFVDRDPVLGGRTRHWYLERVPRSVSS